MSKFLLALSSAAAQANVSGQTFVVTSCDGQVTDQGNFDVFPLEADQGHAGVYVAPNGDVTCQGKLLGKALKILKDSKG